MLSRRDEDEEPMLRLCRWLFDFLYQLEDQLTAVVLTWYYLTEDAVVIDNRTDLHGTLIGISWFCVLSSFCVAKARYLPVHRSVTLQKGWAGMPSCIDLFCFRISEKFSSVLQNEPVSEWSARLLGRACTASWKWINEWSLFVLQYCVFLLFVLLCVSFLLPCV